MDKLTKLKAARADGIDKMQAIIDAADAEDRDMTEQELEEFNALKASDDKLEKQIATEEDMMRRKAAAARPAPSMPAAAGPSPTVPAQPAQRLEPGVQFSRITQALVNGNMDRRSAADYAEKMWGTESGQIVANLEESTDTKGGFLVDEAYSRDFIDLLRPRVAVRQLGARVVPMPDGNLTTRKKTGSTSASYIGERSNIPTTGLTVDQMKLSAKKLAALVPISNDLLRRAWREVDMMVRDDLQESVAVTEDQQFIRGTGSATAPAGLLNLAASANKFNANATVNLQNVDNDLGKLRLALANANVPMTQPGYIISHRIKEFMERLRDGSGNKAYPEIADGRVGAYPYIATTSIPDNLGAGTNESEIYFADFAQVIIGDTYRLTIAASDVASYHDGTDWRSAFQTDETLIRIIEEHDLGVRYDAAIAVLQAVTWAP